MEMRHMVTLFLLVAAVPLQMYLMKYNKQFKEFVVEIAQNLQEIPLPSINFYDYVDPSSYLEVLYSYFDEPEDQESDDDQDPPIDSVRNFRPPHLKFRVGDVVLTEHMVIGVVIGWDIDLKDLFKEPEYFLLAETHEDIVKEDQNRMIGLETIEVDHKSISYYFEKFDGLKYTPQKWLRKLYPKD